MNTYEPTPIENINELIKNTPTYQKYIKTPTVLIGDGIYTISLDFINNHLLVQVYSTKMSIEVSQNRTKLNDPKHAEYNKTIDFAKFIYNQIMKEVASTVVSSSHQPKDN